MKSFPRRGIPVVAYESLNKQVAPPCNLFIRYAPDEKELTLRLQFEFEGNQSFGFLYHADNLSRQTALLKAKMRLPDIATAQLARNKSHSPDVKHLLLSLKQACTIQCRRNQAITVPKPENEQSYRAFLDLARATTVNILFDYKWMADCVSLSHVLNELAGLHGFPVNEKQVQIVEWTALALKDTVPCLVSEDQPPAYCATPSSATATAAATAIKRSCEPKSAEEGGGHMKPPPSTLFQNEKPTLPATSDLAAKPKTGDLNSQSKTPNTSRTTLLKVLTDAKAHNNSDLLAYIETLGIDMLEHANQIRSEADEDFQDTIDNYRMVLEDEKEQTIDSVKSALDEVYNEFRDKKAQAVHDIDDDMAQFRAKLSDELESCMDKNEAKAEAYAERLLEQVCKKVFERSRLAVVPSEEERLELKLLDEREKMLEDEYRERREMLKKERQEIEAHWSARRKLLDAKARILKREYDRISS